jgi:solute carrier family 35 (UDP-sugar transporter), member A1/2/3
MYSATESAMHRPPPIRIASFEKPAIDPVYTPRNSTGNRLNPFEVNAKLATSRPSSPMLARTPSRGNIKRDE